MSKDEALKLTLEALKQIDEAMPFPVAKLAIMQAEKALAQPEYQSTADKSKLEKVPAKGTFLAQQCVCGELNSAGTHRTDGPCLAPQPEQEQSGFFSREANTPLYSTPPQRKPLTDEEIILIVAECAASHQHTDIHFARAIERAHGIKELV